MTTKYKDLAGESYESEWTLNPVLFENTPIETSQGMSDLVKAVEKIPRDLTGGDGHSREAGGEGGSSGPA